MQIYMPLTIFHSIPFDFVFVYLAVPLGLALITYYRRMKVLETNINDVVALYITLCILIGLLRTRISDDIM